MQVNAGGCRWMQGDAGGCRATEGTRRARPGPLAQPTGGELGHFRGGGWGGHSGDRFLTPGVSFHGEGASPA